MKQQQQNEVKEDIENTIKYKINKAKEEEEQQKQWDKQYVQNVYRDRPGTILDFFFLKKEDRGYEWPIMRQRKPDNKTTQFNSFDDRNLQNFLI